MFCRECGKMLQDGDKFCTGCGAKILPISLNEKINKANDVNSVDASINLNENLNQESYANTTNFNNDVNANSYMQNTNYNYGSIKDEDKNSIWCNILALFVPLAGLILFITWKKQYPKKSKNIGICALIGIILSMCSTVVYFIYIMKLFKSNLYDYDNFDRYNNYYYYEDYNNFNKNDKNSI